MYFNIFQIDFIADLFATLMRIKSIAMTKAQRGFTNATDMYAKVWLTTLVSLALMPIHITKVPVSTEIFIKKVHIYCDLTMQVAAECKCRIGI